MKKNFYYLFVCVDYNDEYITLLYKEKKNGHPQRKHPQITILLKH